MLPRGTQYCTCSPGLLGKGAFEGTWELRACGDWGHVGTEGLSEASRWDQAGRPLKSPANSLHCSFWGLKRHKWGSWAAPQGQYRQISRKWTTFPFLYEPPQSTLSSPPGSLPWLLAYLFYGSQQILHLSMDLLVCLKIIVITFF